MTNLILSEHDDIDRLTKLCEVYNKTSGLNSLSETNLGGVIRTLISFRHFLNDIDSLKSVLPKYNHLPLARLLFQLILDIVCKGNKKKFTAEYNVLYNNIQMIILATSSTSSPSQ